MGDFGYYWINPSGPHKIYLTYDKPKLNTVNTLALEKICRYAENQNVDTVIAERGVMGIYGEGWNYNPGKFIFSDPLNLIRRETGQCGDYANLLTILYKSVGIQANPLIIYNGIPRQDTLWLLFWIYSERTDTIAGDTSWTSLLSQYVTSCDDTTKYWEFSYHALCSFGNYYCDAAFGLFEPQAAHDVWWRYYLYPRSFYGPYMDDEPPPYPPIYYHWPTLIPAEIYPYNEVKGAAIYWSHP